MVGVAFIAGLVVFGIVYSFGVLLNPLMAEFSARQTEISAYYAIASLVFYMLGPITGHLSDRFGPRLVTGVGAAAMSGALISTAFIEQVWIGYLTYGFGVGLGAACAYVPTLANLGGWFHRWRTTALGIAATGTGCGMLIMPPFAAMLIEAMGWRHTLIVLGVVSGVLLLICAALVMTAAGSHQETASGSLRESLNPLLRSKDFRLLYASWLFATMALFVPLVLLPSFAIKQGADPVTASWLISILGGTSIIGRLGIGVLGQWLGTVRLFKLATLVMALSYVIWYVFPGYGWLVAFTVVLGLAYGVRIALVAPILITFFGLKDLGTVLGVFFTATGIAALVGPTLAGAIIDISGHFDPAILAAIAMGAVGIALIVPLRHAERR